MESQEKVWRSIWGNYLDEAVAAAVRLQEDHGDQITIWNSATDFPLSLSFQSLSIVHLTGLNVGYLLSSLRLKNPSEIDSLAFLMSNREQIIDGIVTGVIDPKLLFSHRWRDKQEALAKLPSCFTADNLAFTCLFKTENHRYYYPTSNFYADYLLGYVNTDGWFNLLGLKKDRGSDYRYHVHSVISNQLSYMSGQSLALVTKCQIGDQTVPELCDNHSLLEKYLLLQKPAAINHARVNVSSLLAASCIHDLAVSNGLITIDDETVARSLFSQNLSLQTTVSDPTALIIEELSNELAVTQQLLRIARSRSDSSAPTGQ